MKVAVILPAAGLGTRMAKSTPEATGSTRKQFLVLEGAPILVHTIRKFAACPSVTEIVVALRGEDMPWFQDLMAGETLARPVRTVVGGDSRQQTVENALATLDDSFDLVAVHDAVRPFVSIEQIEAVIAAAATHGAAIIGIVPVDTVKRVNRFKVDATIPRERLVLAQTPQVFSLPLLRKAFAAATADNFTGTDESSLVERIEGTEVIVVAGSERNIKITKPTDLELAKAFLAEDRSKANA